MFEIVIKLCFSASHKLEGYEGNCSNLHGHNFGVEICVEGKTLDKIGMVFDFREIKNIADKIISRLDHQYLNEIEPFNKINPTSENIAKYIFEKLKNKLPGNIKLVWVKVSEGESVCCRYRENGA